MAAPTATIVGQSLFSGTSSGDYTLNGGNTIASISGDFLEVNAPNSSGVGYVELDIPSSDFSDGYFYYEAIFSGSSRNADKAIRFEDGSGNWKEFQGPQDARRKGLFFVFDLYRVSDASSGTLDLTDIRKIRLVLDSTGSGLVYTYRLFFIDYIAFEGGDAADPLNCEFIYDYFFTEFNNSGASMRSVSATVVELYVGCCHRVKIGDNSTAFFDNSDFGGFAFLPNLVRDGANVSGFNLDLNGDESFSYWAGIFLDGSTRELIFDNTNPITISGIQFSNAAFTSQNAANTYASWIFQNYNTVDFGVSRVENSSFFSGNGTIATVGDFVANTVRNSAATVAFEWDGVSSIRNSSFTGSSDAAVLIPSSVTAVSLNGNPFSGNLYDFRWEGTETLTLTVDAGSSTDHSGGFSDVGYVAAKVDTPNGGTVVISAPQASLVFNDIPTGTEIRVYSLDAAGEGGSALSELGGIESTTLSSFTVNYTGTLDLRIVLLNEDFEYVVLHESVTGQDLTFPAGALLKGDRVFENQ